MPNHKKPTNLKILMGNPGRRPLPENEPMPMPIVEPPKPPAWMNKDGKAMWARISVELERIGLLTVADLETFAAACHQWGVYVECQKHIKQHGRTHTHTNKAGEANEVKRPEVSIGEKALDQYRAFMTEFGLSPASRTRIEVKPSETESEMEGLLSGIR